MAVFKNLLGIREIKSPIFYKDFSEENKQLKDLNELSNRVKSNKKNFIERDIMLLKAGIQGEKNVYFELKNSFIPMICLHDIRIQEGDYVAQLDFVVVTAQFILILETKKLNGDIYINDSGDFVRSIKNKDGKVIKKEGIYSPISQNERHVRIVKDILIRNGIIRTLNVFSGVVIANPKSIINKSKAPKQLQGEILRYDQLTDFINKKIDSIKDKTELFEDKMKVIAEFFLSNHREGVIDYYSKYSLNDEDFGEIVEADTEEELVENLDIAIEIEDALSNNTAVSDEDIVNKLKEYRLNRAREEKVKPYFIYNNETMEEIISLRSKKSDELMSVRGFGPKKIEKYGEDIIKIFNI